MIHQPRITHAGQRGPDVKAFSRIFREKRIGPLRTRPVTDFFGVHMVNSTIEFQRHHGLKQTGTINEKTFDHLRPYFDGYDRYLFRKETKLLQPSPQDLAVGAWLAMLRHAPFPYREVRRYPMTLAGFYIDGSDCSGTYMGGLHYAHLSWPTRVHDPNGFSPPFDGYGSTYTMIGHGVRVFGSPQKGDAAFYYPTHSHVGGCLGGDRVFSHGKPGDPHVIGASYATEFRRYIT